MLLELRALKSNDSHSGWYPEYRKPQGPPQQRHTVSNKATPTPTRPHPLIVPLPMVSSFFQTTAGTDSHPDPFLSLRDESRGKNNIEVAPSKAIGLGEEPECFDEVRRVARERTKMFFSLREISHRKRNVE